MANADAVCCLPFQSAPVEVVRPPKLIHLRILFHSPAGNSDTTTNILAGQKKGAGAGRYCPLVSALGPWGPACVACTSLALMPR